MNAKKETVLALLDHFGPLRGLQMVKQSGGRLKRGTVYVLLGRMEDEGLLYSRRLADGQREYRISELGERSLVAARNQ